MRVKARNVGFPARNPSPPCGWATVGVGAVVAVPGNAKHAWRNTSSLPATMVLVTTAKMYKFFCEVTKPFDPNQRPAPPTSEEMKKLFASAAKYGYWMASPEENAAIGIPSNKWDG